MSPAVPAATVVLLALDPERGAVLAAVERSPSLSFLGGFTAFPGGQQEPGETLAETCAREAFEEVGVLLAPGGDAVPLAARRAHQARVLAGKPFAEVLDELGLRLEPSWFVPCGRWVTPPSGGAQLDARFMLVVLPQAIPLILPPMTGAVVVCTPQDALRCFMGTEMDVLVLENFVIRRAAQQNLPEVDREKYLSAFALD